VACPKLEADISQAASMFQGVEGQLPGLNRNCQKFSCLIFKGALSGCIGTARRPGRAEDAGVAGTMLVHCWLLADQQRPPGHIGDAAPGDTGTERDAGS